jgi:hypothetical protein
VLSELVGKYSESGDDGLLPAVDEVTQHGYLLEHLDELVATNCDNDDGQLLAYRHPNGFTKIRLVTLPESGWVVRLHVWDQMSSDRDIHCHKWNFASRILIGSLNEKIYRVVDEPAGQWSKFRCSSERGSYSFDHQGRCRVELTDALSYGQGDSYHREAPIFHIAGAGQDSLAVTLFIQGPEQRSTTTVIRRSEAEERSRIIARMYQGQQLTELIQRVLNIISNGTA